MEWVIGIASVVLGLVCGFLLVRAFPGGAATKLSEEHAKATTRSIELDITLTKEREAHADKVAQLNEVTRERDEIRRDLGQLREELARYHLRDANLDLGSLGTEEHPLMHPAV